jgi:mannose-6-phosphate isomerase-like protein (cupin superfamily)
MYGKNFNYLNTKKTVGITKNKFYNISKLFNENEYSIFRIELKSNFDLKIVEKNYIIIFDILSDETKSFLIKNDKLIINKIISKTFFICFQKKKNKLKIIKTKSNKQIEFPLKKNLKILKKEKYWGHISTIYQNSKGSIKVIKMLKNKQSSMEFHINKKESYFIILGKIKLGLRYSRAKQKSIYLPANSSFMMKPGTMHMRMSEKDTIILEMSTKDSDSDSIIVEDGLKYKFNEIR